MALPPPPAPVMSCGLRSMKLVVALPDRNSGFASRKCYFYCQCFVSFGAQLGRLRRCKLSCNQPVNLHRQITGPPGCRSTFSRKPISARQERRSRLFDTWLECGVHNWQELH